MSKHDLVIRGGTIVDGTGKPAYVGDVAISGGVIAQVGTVEGSGAEEVDATGLLVTPGFVDIHTHYDGQAIWSDRLNPSSSHGVTTVVVGNCGVGFAPCRKQDHELLIKFMEGVEDIPGVVMSEGLDWSWETFPQFLDALDARPRDIDMAAYLPHSPLRVYAMGQRGADREDATDEDLAKMRAIAKEAVEAGALGFATSRITLHKSIDGNPIPSFEAPMKELREIGFGMAEGGGGLFQVVPDVMREGSYIKAMQPLVDVALETRQPLTFTFGIAGSDDAGPNMLDVMADARAKGVPITGQVFPRPVGLIMGLDLSIHPFCLRPSYKEIAHLPLDQRIQAMQDPARRQRILSEENDEGHPLAQFGMRPAQTYEMQPIPDYEPDPRNSIQSQADAKGITVEELYYELMLQDGGHKMFLVALANADAGGRLDRLGHIFEKENVVVGLGDGGAHYGMICDSSFPTTLLSHWGRDREGFRIPLERIVQIMTSATSEAVGLLDRGVLAPGYKADVNVIDHAAMTLYAPQLVHDLPAGGKRLDQKADGYRLTLVNGQVINRDGQPTDARPGKLIRGRQPAPVTAEMEAAE